MSIAVSRQLGGTSNLWGGICLRFDPIDFVPRPGLVDARWPITYEELLPFYDRACWHTRSGAPVYELPIPGVTTDDGAFSFHTLERATNEQKSQVIHRKALAGSAGIDVRLCATVVGLNFEANGLVKAVEIVRPDGSQRRRLAGPQSSDRGGRLREHSAASCSTARRARTVSVARMVRLAVTTWGT